MFGTPIQSVTFDRPIPDDTVITDGSGGPFDPMFCDLAISQVVRAPSMLPPEPPPGKFC
jgi:hypothetical protein